MLAWKWPEIADRPFYVSYCMSVHLYSAVRHNSIGRPKQSRLQYLNPLFTFWLQILQINNDELFKHSDSSQSAWDQWVTNYQQKAKQDWHDRQKTGTTGKRLAGLVKTGKTGKRPAKDQEDRKDFTYRSRALKSHSMLRAAPSFLRLLYYIEI